MNEELDLLLDKTVSKSIVGYWPILDRVMYVRLQSKSFNISILHVYAPTIDADEEEMEKFYGHISSLKAQCKY